MNKRDLSNVLRIFFLWAMLIVVMPIAAQTSGDKLYSQGLELQKKQTVQSQRAAIAKFQSAKKLYDSAAKKKQCDDAIAVSNNIIKTISTRKKHVESEPEVTTELKTSVLEVSNEKLQIDNEQRTVTVNVSTTETEWSVTSIANDNGEVFLSVYSHPEDKNFDIFCPANTSTRQRSQSVMVKAGDLKKEIVVEQSGKPTILSVENTVIEFSSKGGSKSINIYSNSNTIIKENNNRNWQVVSKPDWVNVVGEEMKEKGFLAKLGDKAKELVKKNATEDDPSIVTSVMKVVALSKQKNLPSRTGEIVISSENQRATIIVQQD